MVNGKHFAFIQCELPSSELRNFKNGDRVMKHFILTAIALLLIAGTSFAQCPPRSTPQSSASSSRDPEAPAICLESFEMCNNWARHYCLNGNHNAVVNHRLLNLKKRGYIITTKLIRSYAQRTRANSPMPQKSN